MLADVLMRLNEEVAVPRGGMSDEDEEAEEEDGPEIDDRVVLFTSVVDDLGEGPLGKEEEDRGTGGGGGFGAPLPPFSSRNFCKTAFRLA